MDMVVFFSTFYLWSCRVGGVGHVGVLCCGLLEKRKQQTTPPPPNPFPYKLTVVCLLPAVTGQAVLLMRSATWKEMSQRLCYYRATIFHCLLTSLSL